jgi:hypothetical protein
MKKEVLNKIIKIIKEQMSVGDGGFTSSADPKGPVAGYDPVLKMKKKYAKGGSGSRKKWLDYLKSDNGRRH